MVVWDSLGGCRGFTGAADLELLAQSSKPSIILFDLLLVFVWWHITLSLLLLVALAFLSHIYHIPSLLHVIGIIVD